MRIELALESTAVPDESLNDFIISCRLDDSDMVAFARIDTMNNECTVTEYHILQEMHRAGVREGILLDNIQDMVRNKRYTEEVLVASGSPPVNGKNCALKQIVPLNILPDYDKVSKSEITTVSRGTQVSAMSLLAEVVPRTDGINGHNVKGDILFATSGKDIVYKIGDNVIALENETKLYSVFDGYAGFRRGRVCVDLDGIEDFKAYIHFSKNKMDATLVVTPGTKKTYKFTEAWYGRLLEEHGICFGINDTAYHHIPKRLAATYTTKIAEGLHPIKGVNAIIAERYRENTNEDVFIKVSKGDLIVEKIPARKGYRGKNVLGELVDYHGGSDETINHGPGTILSDDGTLLYAETSGYISSVGGIYSVVQCMDLNFESTDSNSKAQNSREMIRITGDVPKGVTVKSDHHIEVLGNVRNADIMAGGILCIRGSVIDCRDTKIQSGHDMIIESASNSRIWSGKNIYVKNQVHNCELIAGGGVYECNGTDCTLSGCRVIVEGEEELVAMGLLQEYPTSVLVGVPESLKGEYQSASKRIIESKNQLNIIRDKILNLEKDSKKDIELYKRLKAAETALKKRLQGGREQLSNLETSVITISSDGKKIASKFTQT